MRFLLRCISPQLLSMLGVAAATLLPTDIQADDLCTGHKGLQTPRPELSCDHLDLRIYPSPDGSLRAVVYPADISPRQSPAREEPDCEFSELINGNPTVSSDLNFPDPIRSLP